MPLLLLFFLNTTNFGFLHVKYKARMGANLMGTLPENGYRNTDDGEEGLKKGRASRKYEAK